MANFFFFFSLSFPLFLLDLEDGGVTDPEGFQAAGISAGLRASSARPDLALVYCPDGAVAAGVFTQNLVCAAPVTYCKDALKESQENMSSVLINAGQANAATGESFHTHTHTHTHEHTRARATILLRSKTTTTSTATKAKIHVLLHYLDLRFRRLGGRC